MSTLLKMAELEIDRLERQNAALLRENTRLNLEIGEWIRLTMQGESLRSTMMLHTILGAGTMNLNARREDAGNQTQS
jgi:hypothetical protein